MALYRVLAASSDADTFWVALLAGGACWLVIYLLLPRPMWIYVFGHELTHAAWTWMMGGQVKKLKVRSSGGHVIVTKSNFLVALAPYFFPLYTMLVSLAWGMGHLIWDWRSYTVWLHLLLGVTYAFHLTLTGHILRSSQPDITENGYLFSFVVIFLGNAVILLFGVPLLTEKVSLGTAMTWWSDSNWRVLQFLSGFAL